MQTEVRLGYNPAFQCLQNFIQAWTQIESKLSEEPQKLEHEYNAQWIKMERRHKQEWARMALKEDCTFQEVFSMVSLAKSVKLLPWCFSTSTPIHHMDDELAATKQQSKTAPATADVTELEEPSAPGLSSSSTCSTETPPAIPLLPDLPLEGTPSMGCPFFESLAGSSQQNWGCFPSGSSSDLHEKKSLVDSQRWRLRVGTALHRVITTCLN